MEILMGDLFELADNEDISLMELSLCASAQGFNLIVHGSDCVVMATML